MASAQATSVNLIWAVKVSKETLLKLSGESRLDVVEMEFEEKGLVFWNTGAGQRNDDQCFLARTIESINVRQRVFAVLDKQSPVLLSVKLITDQQQEFKDHLQRLSLSFDKDRMVYEYISGLKVDLWMVTD